MPSTPPAHLSRRESQIMDILFRLGEASAADVRAGLADPPSYSAVRATLRILEEKGHAEHRQDGPRYVYRPAVAPERARRSALDRLLHTFFGGSAGQAMAALLDRSATQLSEDELDRLARLIEKAKQENR